MERVNTRSPSARISSAFRAKLGVCRKCIRLALLAAVLAWTLVIVSPSRVLIVAAVIFTVPAFAHLLAIAVRRSAGRAEAGPASGCCGEAEGHTKLARGPLLKGAALGLIAFFAAKVTRAEAQVGRTVTVEVRDQNGNPCPNIPVVLADACTFVPATTHRRPMCVSVNRRHTTTAADRHGNAGKATFRQVLPGQYELCVCGGYNCRLNATATGCVVECKGPTRRITVPPAPAPMDPETFELVDCKC